MSVFDSSVATPVNASKKPIFWRILRAFVFGIVIGIVVMVIQAVPKALHNEWLKLESAYDVEYEYLYVNILRRTREGLYYVGISPDGSIDDVLRGWQKIQTDKAFEKIPESDGERVIWQIWLDTDVLSKIDDKKSVPQLMPIFLNNFESLTTLPMASKWAFEFKRYELAGTFAGYFLKNYPNAEKTRVDDVARLRIILDKMNALAPLLDLKSFLNRSNMNERLWPLKWENMVLMYANKAAHGSLGVDLQCDLVMRKIIKESGDRLGIYYSFYKSNTSNSGETKIMNLTEENLRFLPEAIRSLHEHCEKTIN